MVKPVFLSLFLGIFFLSCSNSNTTSTGIDSGKSGVSNHGVTVSDPSKAVAHAVKDSIYNGHHVDHWPNGVIKMSGDVEGGLRSGEWLTFYESGKPWSKGTYVDGLRQGYGVSWFENGNKSSEGTYKDDKPVGKWKYWGEDGKLVEKDFGGN